MINVKQSLAELADFINSAGDDSHKLTMKYLEIVIMPHLERLELKANELTDDLLQLEEEFENDLESFNDLYPVKVEINPEKL